MTTRDAKTAKRSPAKRSNHKPTIRVLHICYALQAVSMAWFFLGITFFAALVVGYIKRADAKGTWLESHFKWQIRTFWYGLLWVTIGVISMPIMIGFIILGLDMIWLIYRIAKGWIYLNDEEALY